MYKEIILEGVFQNFDTKVYGVSKVYKKGTKKDLRIKKINKLFNEK